MMKVKIENKSKNITCKITALEFDHVDCGKRVYMTTKRVIKLLIEEGHNPGNIIEESRVDNCNNKIEGVWVFEDGSAVKEKIIIETPKPKTSNRRKSSRKTKKSLDKRAEDVIIE